MAYGIDLRKRVTDFVKDGGSKVGASRVFKVSLWCVSDWLDREDLNSSKPPEGHNRKFDWQELKKHVEKFPDMKLRERAKIFGMSTSMVCRALKK